VRRPLSQAAEVRLGRQRAPQYEVGDHQIPYLRSANVTDGSLDLADVKSMNFTPAEQEIFGLAPGDVLMTEGSGSAETVGTSAVWQGQLASPVCFQNTLLRLRPRTGITDGRFLAWWARHAHGSGQIAAVSSGANIQHLGSDGLKRLEIDVPPLAEQRRIADFLDARVASIDRIIAARELRIEALNGQVDACWGALDEDLRSRYSMVPIRRLLVSIVDGPFGSSLTSSHYSDEGTRVIRLGNVGLAEFRDDDKAYVPDEYGVQLAAHSVRPGDLLMAGLGDERWPLGRCALAPEDLGPAIVKADCYRIRLDDRMSHDFAAMFLSGPWSRAAFRLLARGSTRARLNTDLARGAEVPLAPLAVQHSYCDSVQHALDESTISRATLDRSIELLAEYKQALITAAVTGELVVTTAGSGGAE
jgi:type I restriction enzyme, S subunit